MAGLWEVTPLAANWEKILLTYLHDPPDKALAIRGHVDRARRYAAIVVGEEESRRLEEAATTADPLASAVERPSHANSRKRGRAGRCAEKQPTAYLPSAVGRLKTPRCAAAG